MAMTASSPKPTNKAENQYGSLKNDNSQAMIKALQRTGNQIATMRCLEKIMPKHANKVAHVPNKTSKEAVGEKQFATKQPSVNPIAYFLLKKQRSTSTSEKRNWIGPYDNGDIAIVKAA